jgi:cytochrome b pre-mRNA-processing protein 3
LLRAGVVIFSARRNATGQAADLAYRRVVEQSRQPVFFTDYRVPDTLDGRFELICLHAFLYLHRLRAERPRANRLSRSFFDRMFADFDRALREMGTGDLSVGKHVKRMARAFHGRTIAYEEGLASDDAILAAAVRRNIFGTALGSAPTAGAMATYIRAAVRGLRKQPVTELLAGHIAFVAPARLPADAGLQLSEVSR